MKSTDKEKLEKVLNKDISKDLDTLKTNVNNDFIKINSINKYVKSVQKSYMDSDVNRLFNLLSKKERHLLDTAYLSARELFKRLDIFIKRYSEDYIMLLSVKLKEYCKGKGYFLQDRFPNMFIEHLLEIKIDSKKRAIKIGTIHMKNIELKNICNTIDQEQKRIWKREFNPINFQKKLIDVYEKILETNPNLSKWVRLENIYQVLKKNIQQENPNWEKKGKLVAYYKDEFSADLSMIWKCQADNSIDPPYVEFVGIRDPRVSYKIILPGGRVNRYGFVRIRKEKNNE